MMTSILSNIICSFAGTLAYAIMFNVPRKYYLSCGLTGVAGWMVYMATVNMVGMTSAMATFCGTIMVVFISRMLTVRLKCPITIPLISGIIPLVPGAGIYFTAYYLMTGEMGMAAVQGMNSVKVAFAIVLGIVFVVAIPRQFFQIGYWKQWMFLSGKKRKA